MCNGKSGVEIDGEKYKIEIISIDDKNDPKLAASGAERLVHQEGIKYIIGPNVDITRPSVGHGGRGGRRDGLPTRSPAPSTASPHENMVLGMIASYQAGPIIYQYLMKNKGVKSVAFLELNASDALNQRDDGVAAAQELELEIISSEDAYEPSCRLLPRGLQGGGREPGPDRVLSGAAPADALLIRTARELG